MPLQSLQILPVTNLQDLTQFLNDFNTDISKKYICGVELGTKGKDAGKNLVVFDSEKTEPQVPTLKEFPGAITEDELERKAAAFQDAEKLVVRSYGNVLLGTEKKWVVLFESAAVLPIKKTVIDPKPVAPTEIKSSPASETKPSPVSGPRTFVKTKAKVHNRGNPPEAFLNELVEWGKEAPAEIFEDRKTKEKDVYASVEDVLGPYGDLLHRKACMLEVMRVLAGFESSWKWNTGRDTTNASENSPDTISAGPFQVSANSTGFGQDLRDLVGPHGVRDSRRDGGKFQTLMKTEHDVAFEYISRLLRHTIRHNGPVVRSEIDPFLSKDAVKEFQELLTT